jgi:large subunit ribosomal protein L18
VQDSKKKVFMRERRHKRLRRKIAGEPERPRLSVYRSLNHIYAEIIDDTQGHTLAAASTLDPDVRDKTADSTKVDAAKAVGLLIASKALEKGISTVVFDRGGRKYHGRVRAVAEGAREGGLQF